MALEAALNGRSPASIRADTASTTTIASSTTRPVARMMPSRVSSLIEKPNTFTKIRAPNRAIGRARAGTAVAFQSCRNRKMISSTSTTASRRASRAPSIEALMKSVWSNTFSSTTPGGRVREKVVSTSSTALAVLMALLPGNWITPKPTQGWPVRALMADWLKFWKAYSARPTSPTRIRPPSGPLARITSSNACTVSRLPFTRIGNVVRLAAVEGGPPMLPAITIWFWDCRALTTASTLRLKRANRCGSTQIRKAGLLAPKMFTWPTPSARVSG
jgi:hypothetical protein